MEKIHAKITNRNIKSPCCHGDSVRFGQRRRQCQNCRRTWRIRKKRRGRKKQRATSDMCLRYLKHEVPSLWALARIHQRSERQLQLRLRRSRDHFLRQTHWPAWPTGTGPLVAVTDAILFKRRGHYFSLYLILLKRPIEQQAIITPFWLEAGRELPRAWRRAFEQIPSSVLARIKAVVCDGHRGPVNYAKQQHWLIQRCHFHLLAAIQGRRSRGLKGHHQAEGRRIYSLVEGCLQTTNEREAEDLLYKVEDEALNTSSPQLKRILRGFVHYCEDFRQYRYHPELDLPITTNAVESLNALIKNLTFRARGFGNLESLSKWLTALLKFKRKATCNGSRHQPN